MALIGHHIIPSSVYKLGSVFLARYLDGYWV
jgi:hypothetical protein